MYYMICIYVYIYIYIRTLNAIPSFFPEHDLQLKVVCFIGWSDNHFNNLQFNNLLDTYKRLHVSNTQ